MNEENRTGKCPKAALVLGAIMITIAAVLIGGSGASQLTATYLVDRNIDKDARDMQRQVKALQQLRAGDLAAAIELLESRLDDNLVLLDPQKPYEGLSERTRSNIQQAINAAKDYRAQHPRSSSRPHVDDMVRHLFEKTES
jgi:hypothetical protein